jgi:hypothetical protein
MKRSFFALAIPLRQTLVFPTFILMTICFNSFSFSFSGGQGRRRGRGLARQACAV